MGTSGSSTGPGPGVSFDPPWLDDIEIPAPGDSPPPDDQNCDQKPDDFNTDTDQPQPPLTPHGVAPPARFRAARRALGEFVRTGDKNAFRRAVGHYSRTGMGGARNAANRMRTSARVGANAFGVLQAARERTDPTINEWVNSLTTRKASVQEIADEIVKRTTPSGGSQDEAACQESMAKALGDLMADEPHIDFFNLDNDHIWRLIESFLAYEAFHRLLLDIGQVFEDSSLSPCERVMRMKEMRDYLRAEISAQIDALRPNTSHATSSQLQSILQEALENTFFVYEGAI